MTIDISEILLGVLKIIVGIVGVFLIPWLKEKFGAEKLAKLVDTIDIFVAAAEQIAERDGYNGAWKKEHVKELLAKNGYKVDETVDEFIEAAVIRLHNELISAA